jgi:hypothetical protein
LVWLRHAKHTRYPCMMAKVDTTKTDVPNDVKAAIEGALRRRLAAYGYRGADIRAMSDMDGDPLLMIDV